MESFGELIKIKSAALVECSKEGDHVKVDMGNYNIIQAIKERLPIQDAVLQYVPEIRHKGRRLWGCCPFHNEKTPSFMVDIGKQTFKCFGGCGASGDVIDFVGRVTGRTNVETIHSLAVELGITNSMTAAEKRQAVDKIQQNKRVRRARGKLINELDLVFSRLTAFERSCQENLRSYEDYERYPASVELQPIVKELLDEYLTFDPEKQINVWRYVKRRLPWLLTY